MSILIVDDHAINRKLLRAVLEANGVRLEDLSEADRTQLLDALNAMSRHPLKETTTSKTAVNANATTSPATPSGDKTEKKVAAARAKKPIGKNQKEVVIELEALNGKGYPAAMNLDTGTGKPAATVAMVKTN